MIYILETDLSEKKIFKVTLQKVFGINDKQSVSICKKLGFSENIKLNLLTKKQVKRVEYLVKTSNIKINSNLQYVKNSEKQKLVNIRTLKGIKHRGKNYRNEMK